MKHKTPTPTAIATRGDGRTHFLHGVFDSGNNTTRPCLGYHGIGHSVIAFDEGICMNSHPVVLSLDGSAFSLQEYLTASEARTLAHALLMAEPRGELRTDLARTRAGTIALAVAYAMAFVALLVVI